MARGPLYQPDYRPQFSGHQTFSLRYGWLKKVFDAIQATEADPENKSVFLDDDAIARFGVGRNMVASMRHWANASGVIAEEAGPNVIRTTELGRKLFGADGLDPYMEDPATLWLIHWRLSAAPDKTSWFWVFNHYPSVTFDREDLVKGIDRLAKERGWARAAATTIRNDVSCFVRTYVPQQPSRVMGHEDALESPLTEIGVIKAIGKRDSFQFDRGPKSTLGNGVFAYALLDFWSRHPGSATLSFEAIAHEPGSPGRVFLLDENDVIDRLSEMGKVTGGKVRWSETAGLKQIVKTPDLNLNDGLGYVGSDYRRVAERRAI